MPPLLICLVFMLMVYFNHKRSTKIEIHSLWYIWQAIDILSNQAHWNTELEKSTDDTGWWFVLFAASTFPWKPDRRVYCFWCPWGRDYLRTEHILMSYPSISLNKSYDEFQRNFYSYKIQQKNNLWIIIVKTILWKICTVNIYREVYKIGYKETFQ